MDAGRAPIVIAHRTSPRHAPENSLEGIRCAAVHGADAVEVDVQLTRDGVPILMHDWMPRRTAGGWWPVLLTSSTRLRRRRLANGEPVPTLAEALAALPPDLGIAIDVKARRAARATIAEVRTRGVESRTLLWAQSTAAVRYCAQHAPEMEPALLRDTHSAREHDRFLRDAVECGARGISAEWHVVTAPFAACAREHGLKLYAWCKDDHPEPAKLSLLDGVVTDWPAEVRALVAQLPGVA